jgi:hypothetical protein
MKQASAVRREDDPPVLVARGDVEKGQFVGTGGVIGDGRRDRIAGVAQIDEVDPLDHTAVLDVEAGDDSDLQHVSPSMSHRSRAARIRRSASLALSRPS